MENRPLPSSEKFTSGSHTTCWTDTVAPIYYKKLEVNAETDVVIIGGGISGLSVAYCLAQEGKKVVVVEDGFIGSGETGRTTAHIVSALDDRYYDLERIFGKDNNKLIAESHARAIDFIEEVVQKEKVDCDFSRVNGYLFLHPSDDENNLEKEFDACIRAGVNVEKEQLALGGKSLKSIRFNRQAQFHPMKYLKGLCEAIIRMGGVIYTNTHADKINSTGIETTEGYTVKAEHIVVATNSPVNNKLVMHLKQYPYRTYVIGLKIAKGLIDRALWWDTGDYTVDKDIPPYHYVRTQSYNATHDILIVGGEDHSTGLADAENRPEKERYHHLEKWAREFFPKAEEKIYEWSGQVLEPFDSLGYIGHNPADSKNVFIVTGDSGNGMTHGTIAGMLISDLIFGRNNKWEQIYSPSRFKLLKSGNIYLKELVGTVTEYLKTKPSGKEVPLHELAPGSGMIVEHEGKKFGAYRDDNNQIHFIKPQCTHQGCIVKFNQDEKTWDCPCHGSRFSFEGQVMNGPANKPLEYHTENLQTQSI